MNTTTKDPARSRNPQGSVIVTLTLLLASLTAPGAAPGHDPKGSGGVHLSAGGQAFEFVSIRAGEFQMGSEAHPREQPLHRVQVPAFVLGKTEVTVRQFAAFTAATGYQTDAERQGGAWKCCWTPSGATWRQPGFRQSLDDPAVCLSWNDAVAFCDWLSRVSGLACRLPSEAEWEYACRAGTAGDYAGDLDELAWYAANSGGSTHPVWQKRPNVWGLYGMHGNGWEWCADVWHTNYLGAPSDGSAWTEGGDGGHFAAGQGRVLRGGAWGLPARGNNGEDCRASSRAPYPRGERCNNSGFRVALTLPSNLDSSSHASGRPGQAPASRQLRVRGAEFDFVRVSPGDFLMGSEAGGIFPFSHKPVHPVRIGQGFYLARTETTFRQFKAFVEATGYVTDAEKKGRLSGSRGKKFENASWRNPPELLPGDTNPVVGVSWNDAVAFCDWLTRETGKLIRLPSEAEWEYACRAGASEAEDERRLDELGWHAANCRGRAQPVSLKQPNAWGLHDMLGNVAEWCADVWHHNYAGTLPPSDGTPWLPESGEERVLRGGHWGCGPKAKLLTAYSREPAKRSHASTQVGFRVVWDLASERGEN